MEPYEALFERIKELMKKEGLTKYKHSMQSGLPHSTVSNIMKGRTKSAGFLSIVNICRGLNISVIEFFQSEFLPPKTFLMIELGQRKAVYAFRFGY